MKSLLVAWKDFRIRITDRRGFLTMILMPLLLTAILGSALEKSMGGQDVPNTTLAYYQMDEDSLANEFRNTVLKNKELRDSIQLKEVLSKEELQRLIQDGKADVGLVLPSRWSEKIEKGDFTDTILLADPGKEVQATIIESMVHSFMKRAYIMFVAADVTIRDFAGAEPVMTGQVDMQVASADIIRKIEDIQGVTVQEEAVGEKVVSSMQYYAAGMGVMFILFNATIGAKMIMTERATETLARLLRTPTTISDILLGKFLGTLLFSGTQFFLFVAVTHYGFGVAWGDNMAQIIAVGLAYIVCVSGLSMTLAAFVHSEKTADMINGVGIQLFALLGGSMLPIYAFSDTMKTVSNIAPNKWALTGLLEVMGGTSWMNILLPISVLVIVGMLSFTLGIWRLRVR
jgi:ABC-2 type transport system permease protein